MFYNLWVFNIFVFLPAIIMQYLYYFFFYKIMASSAARSELFLYFMLFKHVFPISWKGFQTTKMSLFSTHLFRYSLKMLQQNSIKFLSRWYQKKLSVGSFHGWSRNGCQVKKFKFFQIWWPYLFSLQSYSDFNIINCWLR